MDRVAMSGGGQRGVTLIELLTVLAIVAILLSIAIPSFREFMMATRTSTQANDLLADLSIARSEAVKYARRTEVQATGGDWTTGWFVWTDLNGDNVVDANEVVRRQGEAEEEFTIRAGDAGGAVTTVAFGITGTLVAPAGANPVEFAVCRPDDLVARSRGIRLLRSGRAEVQTLGSNAVVNTCP